MIEETRVMESRAVQLDLAARVPFVDAGRSIHDARALLENIEPPDDKELADIYRSSGDDLAAMARL